MEDWKKYWDNVDTGLYALIKQVRKTKKTKNKLTK